MNDRLKSAFMEGFFERQQERAIEYLRSVGIIDEHTPTSRINEFLAAWNISPLPDQESDDVTIDVNKAGMYQTSVNSDIGYISYQTLANAAGMPIDPSKLPPLVSPSLDDEIVDAEIIEDDE